MNGTPHYLCLYFWLHYAMKFEMMCIHCVIESACMQLLGRKCQTVHYNRFTCMLRRNLLKVFLNTIGEKKLNCEMKCYEKQFQSHNARTDYWFWIVSAIIDHQFLTPGGGLVKNV